MKILEIENLSHRFGGGTFGNQEIDLSVRRGEFVVIAGPNGSGKTTLLRHLNGLLMPHIGTVRIAGIPVADDLRRARQMVGMVFQDPDTQIIGETVYDDVAFGPENLKLNRKEIERRVADALSETGLSAFAARRPHLLSGGEKRRLAIAGMLAMKAEIAVFDEPFSNLDYPGVRQVLSAILALHRAGKTIILTTHDLEKVIAHADRLVLMAEGRIVADGPPEIVMAETERFGVRQPCTFRNGGRIESWLS